MKKTFSALLFCAIFASPVFSQVKMPAPSPTEFIKQDFGLSSIELTYSRPGLKGRDVFGNVVQYDSLWRTGANSATKIKFNDPVEFLGHKVDSGSYAIYTIPHKNGEWTFVLNKVYDIDGVVGYKQSEDVFRANVKSSRTANKIETFTMQFTNIKPQSCDLTLMWDNVVVNVPIKVNITDKIRGEIETALASDKKPYWQAAQFYNEYDNNNTKALEMVNEAIQQSGKPPFFMVYYKAKIQKDMGDKKGAIASAKQSMQLAKEAGNNDYVLLNEKLIKEIK